MKKTDLQTGVVYAYKPSKYSSTAPVVLLSLDLYRTNNHRWGRNEPGSAKYVTSNAGRPSKGGGYGIDTVGYLAVSNQRFNYSGQPTDALSLDDLRTLTLDEVLKDQRHGVEGSPRYVVDLINNTGIVGLYDEVMGAEDAAKQARHAASEQQRVEAEARVARAHARWEALTMLGLALPEPRVEVGSRWHDEARDTVATYTALHCDSVNLDVADADNLLALVAYLKREVQASLAIQAEVTGDPQGALANRAEWVRMLTINDDLSD